MNIPEDDERWAPGREAIGREKDAARTWLARREWEAAGIARKSPPSRRTVKLLRLATAGAGIVVLFLGVLLLKPVFHSGSAGFTRTAESIRTVFERVQSESVSSASLPAILNEAAASEAAWSIQRVLCAVVLDDAVKEGLPRLIESALENLRKGDEVRPKSPDRAEPRRSPLSEMFLRFYQSIKEG